MTTVPANIGPIPSPNDVLGVLTGHGGEVAKNLAEGATPAGIADTISQVPAAASKVLSNLGNAGFWKRLGVGAAGVYLILLGVIIILAGSKTVQTGAKAAVGIASKGLV